VTMEERICERDKFKVLSIVVCRFSFGFSIISTRNICVGVLAVARTIIIGEPRYTFDAFMFCSVVRLSLHHTRLFLASTLINLCAELPAGDEETKI